MTNSTSAYVRKCLRCQFEEGQNEVEIDDALNIAAFWDADKLDKLFLDVDSITGEKIEKYPERRWDNAFIDLNFATLSSSEDEFGRLKETRFEFYNNDEREFFFEMITKERHELSSMRVPDFFIPYILQLPDHDLQNVKGFRVINDPYADDDWDFEIYTRQECNDDNELRDISNETRKVLPLAFYSAHRINIQSKRGEPIFVLDAGNNILDGAEEIKAITGENHFLPVIYKAKETWTRYFRDGEIEISLRYEPGQFIHVFFELAKDRSVTIDFYFKVNSKGFIAGGSLIYGYIRAEDSTDSFQVDRTGFIRVSQNGILTNFWWTNVFGCRMKVGEKCAVWIKNFKTSSGFILSDITSSVESED